MPWEGPSSELRFLFHKRFKTVFSLMIAMKVLVVGKGQEADKIAEGAAQSGAEVERNEEFKEGFDLVFLETSKADSRCTGKIALFQAKGFFGNPMENALHRLSNANVVNQISLQKKGLLKNKLSEIDLERARAFGERTVRNLSGSRFEKKSEKQKIRGYRK